MRILLYTMNPEYLRNLIPQIQEQFGQQIENIACAQLYKHGVTPSPENKSKICQQLNKTLGSAPIIEISQQNADKLFHIMGMDSQQSYPPPRSDITFGPISEPENTNIKVFDTKTNPTEMMQLSAIIISAYSEFYKKNKNM